MSCHAAAGPCSGRAATRRRWRRAGRRPPTGSPPDAVAAGRSAADGGRRRGRLGATCVGVRRGHRLGLGRRHDRDVRGAAAAPRCRPRRPATRGRCRCRRMPARSSIDHRPSVDGGGEGLVADAHASPCQSSLEVRPPRCRTVAPVRLRDRHRRRVEVLAGGELVAPRERARLRPAADERAGRRRAWSSRTRRPRGRRSRAPSTCWPGVTGTLKVCHCVVPSKLRPEGVLGRERERVHERADRLGPVRHHDLREVGRRAERRRVAVARGPGRRPDRARRGTSRSSAGRRSRRCRSPRRRSWRRASGSWPPPGPRRAAR